MDRRAKDGLRAGATAVGVAAGLMVLASTAQTPDGFVRASFGGPLISFGETTISPDILAIGDGAADPSELAALLKSTAAGTTVVGAPDSPYRAAFEAGATPNATAPDDLPITAPTAVPTIAEPREFPAPKSVVDADGRVDCTGALSCDTDPVTKVTTVTYPDGVVAIVQKVNDLTVVAYKTLTEYLPPAVATLMPPVPIPVPPMLAAAPPPDPASAVAPAPAPASAPLPEAPPVLAPPTPDETLEPAIDPGPPAPEALEPSESRRGPRVNVTRPPLDFSPDSGIDRPGTPNGSQPDFPGLDKVRDAIGSVVDAVGDAVGKAIGPGAAGKASDAPPSDGDAGQP